MNTYSELAQVLVEKHEAWVHLDQLAKQAAEDGDFRRAAALCQARNDLWVNEFTER